MTTKNDALDALDAAERACLAAHGWTPATDCARPDFWADPADGSLWSRGSAITIIRHRSEARPVQMPALPATLTREETKERLAEIDPTLTAAEIEEALDIAPLIVAYAPSTARSVKAKPKAVLDVITAYAAGRQGIAHVAHLDAQDATDSHLAGARALSASIDTDGEARLDRLIATTTGTPWRPTVGARVVTAEKLTGIYDKAYPRLPNTSGIVIDVLGRAHYVRHDDGTEAPYDADELRPAPLTTGESNR